METPPKKIVIAEQDLVYVYQEEIGEILDFLGLDPAEVLITDESSIYDFSTCYPEAEEPAEDCESYKEEVKRWDEWVEKTWYRRFPGVSPGKDRFLVRIAARIRESRNVQ
jgi:hypothetical protein